MTSPPNRRESRTLGVVSIEPLRRFPPQGFAKLMTEAERAGFRFLTRLDADWTAGVNRFARPGEILFAAWDGDQVVAIGGLNVDPYTREARVGRLRHLYVRSGERRRGIGRSIVAAIIEVARDSFDRLRVRTPDPQAASFYEAIGFARSSEPDCTHTFDLPTPPGGPRSARVADARGVDADVIAVREAAGRHVRAIVEGRLDDAVAEVVPEGRREIRANLLRLPLPLDGRVEDVRADKGEFVVLLWFKTSDHEFGVVLENHWAFVEGTPQLHWAHQL